MPATTSDPISSVLQRTFGGLDHKREGLIRGGNSSSAVTTKPFSVDKQLQASAKHGLVTSDNMDNSISFDAPTSYKSENPANLPKVIILNPGASVSQQNQNNHASNNSSGDTSSNNVRKEVSEQPKEGIPQAKVKLEHYISYEMPSFFEDVKKKHMQNIDYLTVITYFLLAL